MTVACALIFYSCLQSEQVAHEATQPTELPISSSTGMDGMSLNETVVVSLYQDVATRLFVHRCYFLYIISYMHRPIYDKQKRYG